MSRPDAKKNITTLVKAFGENQMLRELANLVLIMVRRRRAAPPGLLKGSAGFAPARLPGARCGAPSLCRPDFPCGADCMLWPWAVLGLAAMLAWSQALPMQRCPGPASAPAS